ncbi:MAG: hypothetical protein E7377_05705 [Clostridiales bacterium]|nr:hypothetical protein [Clostridiales bacterium]
MKKIWLWQLAGLTFTAVLGTLLHFLYGWTDNIAFAPFSAVNESTWEHMKILFFPMLFFAWFQGVFLKKEYVGFWCIKLVGIFFGIVLIPILFYTYNGILGQSPAWVNVAIFFLAAIGGYLLETKLFLMEMQCKRSRLAVFLLVAMAVLFVVFTFAPLPIPLFQDPITGRYGI